MRPARFAPALAVLTVLVVACGGSERVSGSGAAGIVADISSTPDTREPEPSTVGAGLARGSAAPEFSSIESWINSEPLTMAGLLEEGHVILVDFWTYTCINCIRTLPFVRDWYEKYEPYGLTVVGVHSPEFDFEHERANVVDAVARYGLRYPVAQDNEMATWRAFNNSYWPAKYLFGADGSLRYQHFGEGSYDDTEREIREALTAAGHDVSGVPIGGVNAQRLDPYATSITRELFGGYERNYQPNGVYAAQAAYYEAPDRTLEYQDVAAGTERNHNQWYLQGVWRNEREAIVHARQTDEASDYIAFRFVARSVNVVLKSPSDRPYTVVIEIDGRPLSDNEAGVDVVFDDYGRSVVVVDEARVYAVVQLPILGDRELRLRCASDDFSLFAVTFGAYTSGA